MRDQVEKELDTLEKMDAIERVDGPTPWVSNLVVAPKPNALNDISSSQCLSCKLFRFWSIINIRERNHIYY